MSAAQKKKFNKTKRGGPRSFTTEAVSWNGPRQKLSDDSESEEEEIQQRPAAAASNKNKKAIGRSADTSSDEEDSEPDVFPVPKDYGKPPPEPEKVEAFEAKNVNRAATKHLKASDLSTSESVPMSRREREEVEKERAKAAFWKAQMEGKTDQARNDLARLAIIKKQREDAARKRAEEQATKGSASASKSASLNAGKGIISKTLGSASK
ncbi:heat- and acid-stable phosphoprotein [Dinochytrium kinnereticum]|nr:heat- and acid-stable phosphoprotein [Dinochytrium kinnereticum]